MPRQSGPRAALSERSLTFTHPLGAASVGPMAVGKPRRAWAGATRQRAVTVRLPVRRKASRSTAADAGESRGPARNDEEARWRVYPSRHGDVRARGDRHPRPVMATSPAALRRGSKALKGGGASRERLFARAGNAANPMVGSRPARAGRRGGGESRRGGGKPRGRNTVGAGCSGPKAKPARAAPGVDSTRWVRRRGDLRQPQERKPGGDAGRHRPESVGKGGAKGHEGSWFTPWRRTDPRRWSSKVPGRP